MGDKTGIGWTTSTWNPLVGCEHVSAGCDHCYAAREASGRLRSHPAYAGLAFAGQFTGEVRLLPERLDQPLRWRKPRMIFVNSMSDLFHKDVPDEYIARVWAVMASSPQHTFQVLTKRHARLKAWLSRCQDWGGWITHNGAAPADAYDGDGIVVGQADKWPLPNVWVGVSAENQHWANLRIPALLHTPAAVRFISAEPLLSPIDLRTHLAGWCPEHDFPGGFCVQRGHPGVQHLGWVIAGGESGPGARPMHPAWARQLRAQCQAAGVPFFMKQAGEVLAREWGCASRTGHDPAEWPEPFPQEYPRPEPPAASSTHAAGSAREASFPRLAAPGNRPPAQSPAAQAGPQTPGVAANAPAAPGASLPGEPP